MLLMVNYYVRTCHPEPSTCFFAEKHHLSLCSRAVCLLLYFLLPLIQPLSSSSHWKRQGSGTLNVYLTMQKHITTYFESEVSTAAVGCFECFRRLEATGVICDIHSIKEVVKLLNEFCCLSSVFSKEELDPLCHYVAQNLNKTVEVIQLCGSKT